MEPATIVMAVVILVVLGLCLYLIETYVPMAQPIKLVIRVVVVLGLCLYLLRVFKII